MSRRTTAEAIWETVCAACPHPIAAGDRIVITDVGWAHDPCRDDLPPAESTDVCPTCWLHLPLSGVYEECEDR